MGIRMLWGAACLAAATMTASPAEAQLLIDDFTMSPYTSPPLTNHPTWLTKYQTGPFIVGGVRQTNVTVSQGEPAFGQSTQVQIRPAGPLVVSGGYKSYFGLLLSYGYSATGGANRLDLNLKLDDPGSDCLGCDRFRIDFDGSDSELSYLMQVLDRNGHYALLAGPTSLAGQILPFAVEFPFADFEEDPAYPVDWSQIDYVYVLFQTGTPLGGHDFAVTKITAVPPPAS